MGMEMVMLWRMVMVTQGGGRKVDMLMVWMMVMLARVVVAMVMMGEDIRRAWLRYLVHLLLLERLGPQHDPEGDAQHSLPAQPTHTTPQPHLSRPYTGIVPKSIAVGRPMVQSLLRVSPIARYPNPPRTGGR
jgi:hypothetical protein